MAERRMFAKTIVLSDAFLDMPMSARCLYFTLNMFADDDGFVNSPKGIMRQCGASEDDMRVLISKKYVLTFDDGVIVIKHWRINNYLQKDRYHETKYIDNKSKLTLDENNAYKMSDISDMYTEDVYTQDRLGKDRLGKDIDNNVGKKRKVFKEPTVEEVAAYCKERKNHINAETFVDFYTAKEWMIGKNKMKDWKAAVRTWEKNDYGRPKTMKKEDEFKREYDFDDLERQLLNG